MGPRVRGGTAQRGVDLGNKFGFIASTDFHRSFPGEYGLGLAAVVANELTREGI
jgi:hypothetical protein